MIDSLPIAFQLLMLAGMFAVGLLAGWRGAVWFARRRAAHRAANDVPASDNRYGRRASDFDRMMAFVPAALYRVENLHTGKPPEFRFFNERIQELVGYSKSEIETNPGLWAGLMHPDDRKRYEATEASRMMKSEHSVLEHRFLHKDGRYRWIRRYVWHVYDHAAALRETLGCAVDITELKDAEEKLQQFLDGGPDPVITSNSRGQIVRANTQATRVFGYPQDALIGHDFSVLVAEESKRRAMQYFEALAARRASDQGEESKDPEEPVELRWRSKAGATFPGEIRIRKIVTDRDELYAIGILGVSGHSKAAPTPATTQGMEAKA